MKKCASVFLIMLIILLIGGYIFNTNQDAYNVMPLMVMVNDVRYVVGEPYIMEGMEPEVTGYILKQCTGPTAAPFENETSNFPGCVDQPYAYVEGRLLLYLEGEWHCCYPESEWPPEHLS